MSINYLPPFSHSKTLVFIGENILKKKFGIIFSKGLFSLKITFSFAGLLD